MSNIKLSREEFRKAKDLEEARKAGTAPAELDEDGNEINPHIPQYISKAPCNLDGFKFLFTLLGYLDSGVASLKHQRPQRLDDEKPLEDRIIKGVKSKAATKYRKGACQNCGAITHATKDCVERPRKIGAKFSGKDIRPDEIFAVNEETYDSKRDRWKGYDPKNHSSVFKKFELVDDARKKLKAKELDDADKLGQSSTQKLKKVVDPSNIEFGSSDDSDEDDERYAEKSDMPGQKVDTKSRTTVRNLRIREDIPKYLRNLDIDSAYYDPKSRSMRDNPYAGKNVNDADYAGDNFVRQSGDAPKMAEQQLFAWKQSEAGLDQAHLQANPTLFEQLYKQHMAEQAESKQVSKQSILATYGGTEHLDAPDRELLLAQSDHYVEYNRTGRVIKGQPRAIAQSKYPEDVYLHNHTSVWGSYWENGQWGYQCCKAFLKNAYCVPESDTELKAE